MKMCDLIVYSTISRDGIIRWALHPMSSAPVLSPPGRRLWPFRVLWRGNWDDDCLAASCRGTGWDDSPEDMSTDEAMRWLVEGER